MKQIYSLIFKKGKEHGGVTHNIDAGENQEKNKKVHAPHLA